VLYYEINQWTSLLCIVLISESSVLFNRFLTYSPARRTTAEEALKHDFFLESPLPVDPSMFPTWPAKSEMSRSRSHGNSPKPPSGGKAYANLFVRNLNISRMFFFVYLCSDDHIWGFSGPIMIILSIMNQVNNYVHQK